VLIIGGGYRATIQLGGGMRGGGGGWAIRSNRLPYLPDTPMSGEEPSEFRSSLTLHSYPNMHPSSFVVLRPVRQGDPHVVGRVAGDWGDANFREEDYEDSHLND